MPGPMVQCIGRGVSTGWKPVLCLQKGSPRGKSFNDVIKVPVEPERHHKWGQGVVGIRGLVERVTDPAETVLDPFCGGGSTGVACIQLNRKFIGIDLDEAAAASTKNKLIDTLESNEDEEVAA
jgi:DNA modification methylase